MKKVVVILICLIFMVGCSSNENAITYKNISGSEAYEIMNSEKDAIILDVRTESEFLSEHIKNAINLPLDLIEEKVESVVDDKDAIILVYCRSGNRSVTASDILVSLGYTNVSNFGGISTWEYDIVSD